eukprot:g64176.t1
MVYFMIVLSKHSRLLAIYFIYCISFVNVLAPVSSMQHYILFNISKLIQLRTVVMFSVYIAIYSKNVIFSVYIAISSKNKSNKQCWASRVFAVAKRSEFFRALSKCLSVIKFSIIAVISASVSPFLSIACRQPVRVGAGTGQESTQLIASHGSHPDHHGDLMNFSAVRRGRIGVISLSNINSIRNLAGSSWPGPAGMNFEGVITFVSTPGAVIIQVLPTVSSDMADSDRRLRCINTDLIGQFTIEMLMMSGE